MSAMSPIQSSAVPFAVGTDGIAYKNLVCKRLWGLTINPTITEEESDCGVAVGVGIAHFSFNFEIIMSTTPNGATEVSANTTAAWANNGTLVYVKLISGSDYIRKGSGYISNYQESAPLNGVITATGTITGNGTISLS